MSRWWQRSWAVAVSGAFAATVSVLGIARCKSAEREAWQRVHERAKTISAPYVRGVEPHAPLNGSPQPGFADRHYAAADEALWALRAPENLDELDIVELHELFALAELPAETDRRLARYERVLAAVAAGAAADQIYYGTFRDALARSVDATGLPMPVGCGTVGVAVLLAARLDLEAGRHAAAVQRTVDVLTLARDQLRAAFGMYDLLAAAHVDGVCGLWNDARLSSLPPAEARRLADALLRFDMMCNPATSCAAGEAHHRASGAELAHGFRAEPEQFDAYVTAVDALPADTAPWSQRQPALAAAAALLPNALRLKLAEIEHARRNAVANIRLLRMAVAHHLGEQVPVLLDPFGEAPLQASAHEGGTKFASTGTDLAGKPIERIVRAR